MAACPPQDLIDLKQLMKMSDGRSVGVAPLSGHGHSLIQIILQKTGVIAGIHPHQKSSPTAHTDARTQGQQQRFQEESDDTQGQRRAQATSSSWAIR